LATLFVACVGMSIRIFQVDAFSSVCFKGNPAAVCPLNEWLPDNILLSIAAENNLSETAFYLPSENGIYELRWFSPNAEVDLCGHATLATAFVIFQEQPHLDNVIFRTKSGDLRVARQSDSSLEMQFPAREGVQITPPSVLQKIFEGKNIIFYQARDCMAVLENEEEVLSFFPDVGVLEKLDGLGFIVTAPGKQCDVVSRCFYPKIGILEDPVTGSAHCTIIPYWANKLNKTSLHARQLSPRGGDLWCKYNGNTVNIRGSAVLYMEGTLKLPLS
jgi:PhzF family phenazine biosynthesis protein